MDYKLTFELKPGYLHAKVTGANTRANIEAYAAEAIRECGAKGCKAVLIEERLEGPRLSVQEVFALLEQGIERFRGSVRCVAFVDVYAEGKTMQFAETVAFNRGFPLRVFATVAEAERWLLERQG